MKCPNCRKPLREGAKFCPACGAKLKKRKGIRITTFLLFAFSFLILIALGCIGGVMFAKFTGGNSSVLGFLKGSNSTEVTFSSDSPDVVIKTATDVTFTVKICSGKHLSEIPIICENETVGSMKDDGKNGDVVKGDGIYTGIVNVYSEIEKHSDFYAKLGEKYSDPVTIFFYSKIVKEDFDKLDEVNSFLNDIQTQYIDENGYVPIDHIPSMLVYMGEKLNEYVNNGVIRSLSINQDSIFIKFSSGIPLLFIPYQEGTLASGAAGDIITFAPAESTFTVQSTYNIFVELDKKYNKLEYQGKYDISACADFISNELNKYSYRNHFKDGDVTIDKIKTLNSMNLKNGILLWEGHGGYNEAVGSALVTGEEATWKNNAEKYSADLKEDRLVTTTGWATLGTNFINCDYAITSKFVDTYFDDSSLDNCLVYLGACSSGNDSRLADSFIKKGASVVFANVGKIGMEYEILTRTTILYNMCKENSSGQLNTAEESLTIARSTIGAYDPANKTTYVTCYGEGETFRFSDFDKPLIVKITDPTDAYDAFRNAAKKTTETGSWSEHAELVANMEITNDTAKAKTQMTMSSSGNVSNYIESNPSKVCINGAAEMSVMGQTYAWNLQYENGIAHYQYTEPNTNSVSMTIDPSFFNFDTISSDMVTKSKISGNQISFTVPGDKITEVGIAAVTQINGIENLNYGDVDVAVTISNEGTIDTISMKFHASMKYQGYDAEVDYDIVYRFSASSTPIEISPVSITPCSYVNENSKYDILTVHEVNGNQIVFSAWWYRIWDVSHATATLQGNIAYFDYTDPNAPNRRTKGTIEFTDKEATLIISECSNSDIQKTPYHFSFLAERIKEQQLKEISRFLGVPDDLAVTYEQGIPYYWEGAGIHCTEIGIYYKGELIAGADVNSQTGAIAGSIYMYSGDTASSTAYISGSCGDNLSWTLSDDGTLTISGSGNMKNYPVGDDDGPPWLDANVNVQKIVFEGNITSIGENAFCYTRITSITIPESVTMIQYGALNHIDTLAGIWVESGNTVYTNDESGVLLTKDKTALISAPAKLAGSYTVPKMVNWIYDNAFLGCTAITSIEWSDSINHIGQGAFSGCSGLKYIRIPENVTTIEPYTFYACSNLTNIDIPETVDSIGWIAFGECPLKEVNYGGTIHQWHQLMTNCSDDTIAAANINELSY